MQGDGSIPDVTDIFNRIPHIDSLKKTAGQVSVFLVGGAVRDYLIHHDSYDWDFVVDGDAEALARAFADETESSFIVLDEMYRIYRVVSANGNLVYDFADLRENLETDLKLRDFTINALAVHLTSGDLIDPCGSLGDLEARIIRVYRKNNLIDDPLRILRAYRMKTFLGFEIDDQTREWIRETAQAILQPAPERIRDEIFKILKYPRAAEILREIFNDGILTLIFPELIPMIGMSQNRFHRFDVLEHSFVTLEELESVITTSYKAFAPHERNLEDYMNTILAGDRTRLQLMKLAAVLHDMGKPPVRKVENGILYYLGHHTEGKAMWLKVAERMCLSRKETKEGGKFIEFHLDPVFIPLENNKDDVDRASYRFFKNTGETAPGVLLLSWSDVEAGKGEALTREMIETHHSSTRKLITDYFEKNRLVCPTVFLNGRDIMKILEVSQGKLVGEILEELREQSALEIIDTRDQAVRFLERYREDT